MMVRDARTSPVSIRTLRESRTPSGPVRDGRRAKRGSSESVRAMCAVEVVSSTVRDHKTSARLRVDAALSCFTALTDDELAIFHEA